MHMVHPVFNLCSANYMLNMIQLKLLYEEFILSRIILRREYRMVLFTFVHDFLQVFPALPVKNSCTLEKCGHRLVPRSKDNSRCPVLTPAVKGSIKWIFVLHNYVVWHFNCTEFYVMEVFKNNFWNVVLLRKLQKFYFNSWALIYFIWKCAHHSLLCSTNTIATTHASNFFVPRDLDLLTPK